jgi:hypothetical protein
VPWLGVLFGILAGGLFLHLRAGDELPSALGSPAVALKVFQQRNSESLIMSGYATKPTNLTMQALLLNIQGEFVLQQPRTNLGGTVSRNNVGTWILASIATRLAMRVSSIPSRLPVGAFFFRIVFLWGYIGMSLYMALSH